MIKVIDNFNLLFVYSIVSMEWIITTRELIISANYTVDTRAWFIMSSGYRIWLVAMVTRLVRTNN